MENAGRCLAEEAQRVLSGRSRRAAAVFCGGGNNGGDGFAAARHLASRGIRTVTFVLRRPGPASRDAAAQFRVLRRLGLEWVDCTRVLPVRAARLGRFGVIVDALLGTGVSRPLAGRYARAVKLINRSGLPVVSADLPSGLDADTGRAPGECVTATTTVTFLSRKKGLMTSAARRRAGRIVAANLSIPDRVLSRAAAR